MNKKFYATYKPVTKNKLLEIAVFGNTQEIALFDTEQERDDWVNEQDTIFKRRALTSTYAVRKIRATINKVLTNDIVNPNIKWYLLGGAA